jgi:hypothetical protein
MTHRIHSRYMSDTCALGQRLAAEGAAEPLGFSPGADTGRLLSCLKAALGALAGALGATAAAAAPLPPFCFLAGLDGSFRHARPVAVALAATALASAFGVVKTKQKMEELLGALVVMAEDPLQRVTGGFLYKLGGGPIQYVS